MMTSKTGSRPITISLGGDNVKHGQLHGSARAYFINDQCSNRLDVIENLAFAVRIASEGWLQPNL